MTATVERLNVKNKYAPQVHPAAEVFPMMDDEALADLAADIKANGQLVPIMIDKNGVLIDGRNRLKACQAAEVEPRFETYGGDNPVSYILAINVSRRHMAKSQIAMAVAKTRSLETKDGRRLTQKEAGRRAGVSETRVAQAETVIGYAPDLSDAVLAGTTALDDAYAEALHRKEQAGTVEAKMEQLRKEAPDLADQVTEERLKFEEAWAALGARKEEAKRQEEVRKGQRKNATGQLHTVLLHLYPHGHLENLDAAHNKAMSWAAELDGRYWPSGTPVKLDDATIAACITTLEALRAELKKGTPGNGEG